MHASYPRILAQGQEDEETDGCRCFSAKNSIFRPLARFRSEDQGLHEKRKLLISNFDGVNFSCLELSLEKIFFWRSEFFNFVLLFSLNEH